MIDSKLLNLVQCFEKSEWKAFRDFVASPYYNRRKELIPLCQYLRAQAPAFRPKRLEMRRVFKELYGDKPYDEAYLRHLMSYLTKLAIRFLGVHRFEQDDFAKSYSILEAMMERGLEKNYAYHFRQASEAVMQIEYITEDHFFRLYQMADLEDRHFLKQRVRRFDPSLQQAADMIDKYYLIRRLKYACIMLDRGHIFSSRYEVRFLDQLRVMAADPDVASELLIQTYLFILNLLDFPEDTSYFKNLKAAIYELNDHLHGEQLQEVYLFAINHCLRELRKGKEAFLQEAIELYELGINNQMLQQDSYLSPWTYTNVVKLALRLERFDWVEYFINDKRDQLPPAHQDNVYHYNLAELYYYKKSFDLALVHLNQARFSDLNFYLGSRVLLIKLYYERGEEEALLSLLASFSIFLRRDKDLSRSLRKTYLNFCQLLSQILRRNPKKKESLQKQLQETELLTDRKWLFAVLKEQ